MTNPEDDAPKLIVTHVFPTGEEAAEAVAAADRLNLGVRLYNQIVPDEDGEGYIEEWVVELFDSAPELRIDEEENGAGEGLDET
ncbi:hypothetical protein [Streptoalloteichus tenebrarius]|uniref:hypothetical protein n=1 Tax=Streptoalloteichus tenebrarius (strain ATCC 17920 / DSM 40477 / JCM 4838 / CBS 697.72 / NBRC 16177 / NCIMB 11028 / NRRL B-12390 / A12253. 1 / ISP 5477) TaxID=1933 RepID=UPI0020A5B232|nr:hypothetical protein [Streptoalloteichus tenebrarius]